MAAQVPPNIFGNFTGGQFANQVQFSNGLTPGSVVPFSPFFNPSPLLNTAFQPFPWAANALITSNLISLTGGGTPLIQSFPTVSPFTNPFLNLFNPAISAGLGGTPGFQIGGNLPGGAGNLFPITNPPANVPAPTNSLNFLRGFGGQQSLGFNNGFGNLFGGQSSRSLGFF